MLKFDFHIHSFYSFDSVLTPAKIVEISCRKGLDGIVVADHNTIRGGLETKDINRSPLVVIVGSEIKTEWGDVVCLFLEKEITTRRFLAVVVEVRKPEGIMILAHPFWKHTLTEELLGGVDLIETFNSRISPALNRKAEELALSRGIPQVAGSDAHLPWEIGRGITCLDVSALPEDLKPMILKEKRNLVKVQSNPFDVVITQGIKLLRKKGLLKQIQ
ncbi:MAG: PHP domain-containing protein [Candidatus Zixiibacteriota bacterium]